MEYEKYTKKELAAIIREMKAKLSEMKDVEKQVTTEASELSAPGLSIHRDEKGKFHLVKLKYDIEKNAATIEKVESLDSSDPAIATFKAKQYLVETIIAKAKGGKYVK